MIIPDVNVLVYAVHAESEQHAAARAWLDKLLTGDEPVGFCWAVLAGFIRVSTNPRVVAMPARLDRATELVDLWLAQRVVSVVEPGPGHWTIMRALLREAGRGGNLTTDAHLAALCIEGGATLHSADGDFARFRGLRYENPLR
ncbi:type II toxin-antitoxin system VapC family toxin [Gemmatimonas sp.]|uniref:type II toxin-antitoxin system VapC family toxin n=1 Tax=Gemmatimonas sp. TaxID=1962908 RepID=UPI00286AFA4A|nr:type II toxin-antitoxin system VapC family toxin [Gemmatimonas sp.]